MKITFILGNGFDVQLGLETKYSHFIENYIQPRSTDDDNIKEFKDYLRERPNRELWSHAEKAMGTYLGDFSDEDVHKYTARIDDFETKLIEYLEEQQNSCSYENSPRIKTVFLDYLFNSFNDVLNRRKDDLNVASIRGGNTYQFITFNYTNLLKEILTCCHTGNSVLRIRQVQGSSYQDLMGKIHHVHGTLGSQIIMGVNDESQLDLSKGVTLTDMLKWRLIKPQINSDSRNNWDIPALQMISDSDIIAVYGVSYGETDKLWWDKILEWLKASPVHKIVAFTRSKEEAFNPKLPAQELIYELNKRTEILDKLGFKAEDPAYEKVLTQIYIISDTKRLELKNILRKDSPNKASAAMHK